MKILVFDDNPVHLNAAKAQLGKEHELTIVDSYDEARKQVTAHPDFDVVLTDLLVPASGKEQGVPGTKFVGQEMPVGIFIGLLAAKNGVKYVAVFTDSSHHHHPASACFDSFNRGELHPVPFTVNGAKVILSNTRIWVNHFDPSDLAKEVDLYQVVSGGGSYNEMEREGLASGKVVIAKNWAKLLYYLLNDKHMREND